MEENTMIFVGLGVLCLLIFSFLFLYNQEISVNQQFVSKTEYVSGDEGQVIVELRNAKTFDPIPATCYASVWYPNKSNFINQEVMVQTNQGTQFINFTVPSIDGVYEYQTNCSFSGKNYFQTKSFHVSKLQSNIEQKIDEQIQIIPQGVNQVNLDETAAESWLFNVNDFLGVNFAACNVYKLTSLAKDLVIGLIDENDFDDGNISSFKSLSNGGVLSFAALNYNIYSGSPVVQDNSLLMTWPASSGKEDATLYEVDFPDDWILSFKLANEGSSNQVFNLVLLGNNSYGDYRAELQGNINDAARHLPPKNALLGFGIGVKETSAFAGWAMNVSIQQIANDTGSGNIYFYRNDVDPITNYRYYRTNADYSYLLQVSTEYSIVKIGNNFKLYQGGVLKNEWTDTLEENPGAIFISAVSDNPAYEWLVDDIQLQTVVNDSKDYSLSSKLFTYYWSVDKNLIEGGQNYVVDCLVELIQSSGITSLVDLNQYVFVNKNKRLGAYVVR